MAFEGCGSSVKGRGLLLLSSLICLIVSILFLIIFILFAYFFELEMFHVFEETFSFSNCIE